MKVMSKQEFTSRHEAVLRAKKIYIESGITNNITTAFELYQEILSDMDREIFITGDRLGPEYRKLMSRRPIDHSRVCPDCKSIAQIRSMPPTGRDNLYGWKSAWFCLNVECCWEEFSRRTMQDELKRFPPKEAKPCGGCNK